MKDQVIRFLLDGAEQEAQPGETIWDVASRTGNPCVPNHCARYDLISRRQRFLFQGSAFRHNFRIRFR